MSGILRKKEELPNMDKDTRVNLVFNNRQQFYGLYQEMDDNNIMLKSERSENQIGLPFKELKFFIETI